MGNAQLRKTFKSALNRTTPPEMTGADADVLLEAELVDMVLTWMRSNMSSDSIGSETFPQRHEQKNEDADGLDKREAVLRITDNAVCGFSTAENIVENLKEPGKPLSAP